MRESARNNPFVPPCRGHQRELYRVWGQEAHTVLTLEHNVSCPDKIKWLVSLVGNRIVNRDRTIRGGYYGFLIMNRKESGVSRKNQLILLNARLVRQATALPMIGISNSLICPCFGSIGVDGWEHIVKGAAFGVNVASVNSQNPIRFAISCQEKLAIG